MKNAKLLTILIIGFICIGFAACQKSSQGQGNYSVEPLTNDEFAYYADNANVFADDVLANDAKFLYVQLAYDGKAATVANDNADGICSMIEGDHHDVLDLRKNTENAADTISEKLQLSNGANLLVIGDDAGEQIVYEELAKMCGNIEYKNANLESDSAYEELYSYATESGFDAVIVANGAAAFHDRSFPFAS